MDYLVLLLVLASINFSTQGDIGNNDKVKENIIINGKNATIPDITNIIPPQPQPNPHNNTTMAPNTTTTTSPNTTTLKPNTTTTPSSNGTTTPTTLKPKTTTTPIPTTKPTTTSPNSTTHNPPPSPNTTVTPVTSTVAPTKPTPVPEPHRKFDGPSFVGGIVLALGLVAIGFVAFKFYKARLEVNYHTL